MNQALTWLRRNWVSTLIGLSLSGGGSGLFEYWRTGGVTGWIPVQAALIGALILTGWTALMGKSEPQTPEPPESVEGKAFSRRSVQELTNLTRGKMAIEANNATKPHIGKWLRVQGHILNVYEPTEERMTILLIHGSWFSRRKILAYFDRGSRDRLETLPLGHRITVDGEIAIITGGGITLTKCELVVA